MLHRCYSIASNRSLFNDEISFLRSYYISNGFPSTLFMRTVRKFIDRITNPPLPSYNVPKDKHFISMPFFGHHSYVMRNRLLALFRVNFPQIDLKIVLTNKRTIGSLFPTKERLPDLMCSNVIYHYKCESENCESSYVGSTARALYDRICEHEGISNRTGNKLSSLKHSSIREHAQHRNHPIRQESFRIIGRSSEDENLRLLESVYIKHLKPTLNNTESAVPLFII